MNAKAEVPDRIKPFYETPEPGKEIELRCESASITQNDTVIEGQLRVIQQWSPMHIVWEFSGTNLGKIQKDDNARVTSKTFDCDLGVWGVEETQIWGFLQGQYESGDENVHEVYFHLPNYPNGLGSNVGWEDESSGKSSSWLRLILKSSGWIVEIESHKDQFHLRTAGREKRDVVLSGIGVLRREDRAAFSTHQAVEVLDGVRVFLSFAFGEWCPPVLLVGTASDGSKIWERWANYDVRCGWHPNGWLGPWQRTTLTDAFSGFYNLWQQPRWREPLQLAVTWLIEANRQSGGVEGAIAFGQIPLEMLSWLIFIDMKTVTKEERKSFKELSAADKMKRLLSHCVIPLAVPNEMSALTKLSQETAFKTGPDLVAKVRNTIIHPDEKNRRLLSDWENSYSLKISDIRWETQQLFQWYSTLVLLSLIGYSGKYANRLTPWKLEKGVEWLPWAIPDAKGGGA